METKTSFEKRFRMTPGAAASVIALLIVVLVTFQLNRAADSDTRSIAQRTAAALAAAQHASKQGIQNCHVDIEHINATHAAVREQIQIQIDTTRQATAAIHVALDSGQVPDPLKPLYRKALVRNASLIKQETALKATVKQLVPLC